MSTNPAIDSTATEGLSQIERVVDVFVAPSKTFKDILRSTAWWMPLLLLSVLSLCSVAVMQQQVGFERAYENQLNTPAAQERMSQVTPEQKAQQMKVGVMITKVISYAIPVFILVTLAIYALILWGCFNFILGAQTTFPQVLAVTLYASLPTVLLSILLMVTLSFGGNAESYDYNYPVGTNLGYYLADSPGWLRALLGRLDLIQLWILGLVTYGMSVIAKKTVAQSAMIVVGLWLLATLGAGVRGAFS